MCLAIFKPEGKTVPKIHLVQGFHHNDDGAGFAYVRAGKLFIEKGFFTFKSFYKAYRQVVTESVPAVIHFRIATHGATTGFNCHPWSIRGHYAVIHNGVLGYPSTKEKSDTGHFVDEVLAPLFLGNHFNADYVKYLVEKTIGYGNKLVVLHSSGRFMIYNRAQGEEEGGIWYSNTSFKREIYKEKKWPNDARSKWTKSPAYYGVSEFELMEGMNYEERIDWSKRASEQQKKYQEKAKAEADALANSGEVKPAIVSSEKAAKLFIDLQEDNAVACECLACSAIIKWLDVDHSKNILKCPYCYTPLPASVLEK